MRRSVGVVSICLLGFLACGDDATSPRGGGSGQAPSAPPIGDTQSGIATFYAADGTGNCSFDRSADLDVAALDTRSYAASAACGSCLRVRGPKGEVTVRVVDSCPDCDSPHVDLSREAFAKIADPAAGRVEVSMQAVPCEVTGNVAYRFKDGSSQYWTAIQVRNHRLPITKLEYRRDGAFVEMKRESYNYFVESAGVGPMLGGLIVRVTASDGQTLTDELPRIAPEATFEGAAQFR